MTRAIACLMILPLSLLLALSAAAQQGPLFSTAGWGDQTDAWGQQPGNPLLTRLEGTASQVFLHPGALAAGDIDGDGCTDLAIGIPSEVEGVPSRVRILYGTAQGWEPDSPLPFNTVSPCRPAQLEQTLEHDAPDQMGLRLLLADVTGDGLAELIVSAPAAQVVPNDRDTRRGQVQVYPGTASGLDLSPAVTLVAGATPGETLDVALGTGLSVSPDLTGDGILDLWVSSKQDSSNDQAQPRAILWPGSRCWSDPEARGCPALPDREVSADELQQQTPFFELKGINGPGSQFGAQVVTWNGVGILLSDPNGMPPGESLQRGTWYPFSLTEGEQVTVAPPAPLLGADTTYSQAGTVAALVEGEGSSFLLSGAPSWGYMSANYQGKLGRLERLSYQAAAPEGEAWQKVGWERPAWDSSILSSDTEQEAKTGWGLGTALALLGPQNYVGEGSDRHRDAWSEAVVSNPGLCRSTSAEEIGVHPGRVYLLEADLLQADAALALGSDTPDAVRALPASLGWEGETDQDCFGAAVAGGDFNGDGIGDLAILAQDGADSLGTLSVLWSVGLLFDPDGDGFVQYWGLLGEDGAWAELSDGSGRRLQGGDCDETRSAVHGGAEELCNGLDDDCDGVIDEALQELFYRDEDGDGFGADESTALLACPTPAGYTKRLGDCNDHDPEMHPGALERCNGLDDDCDADSAESEDQDLDGYLSCLEEGADEALRDCNDSNPDIHPGATEQVGDGVDSSCDGLELCTIDADQDGYARLDEATAVSESLTCDQALGLASAGAPAGDCDDSDPAIHPGATEDYGTATSESCTEDHFMGCLASTAWQAEAAPGCGAISFRPAGAGMVLLPLLGLRRRSKKAGQLKKP